MNPGLILFAFLIFSNALAGESDIELKAGDGKDLVAANCMMCHSLDYIQMNAAVLDKQGWEKTVDKMIKVMGAPIKPEDAAAIAAYLARNYGK
ncbi:MAG: cytochrome c [Methylomicrobium sp.]